MPSVYARTSGAAPPDLTESARNAVGNQAWRAVSSARLGSAIGSDIAVVSGVQAGDSHNLQRVPGQSFTTELLLTVFPPAPRRFSRSSHLNSRAGNENCTSLGDRGTVAV